MPKSPFTGHKPWILLSESSPHGPEPITLMADGERIDNNLPYYVRSKAGRNKRAYTVKMCNAFGMHLICPRQACRRSGTCADADLTKLPYCFHRYRESFRHALFLAMEHYGMYGHDAPNSRQTDFGDAPPPEPFTGVPLVQRLLDAGAPREVLERPTGVGITDWTCERDESAKASMAEMRERRLAREAREKGNAPRLEADPAPKRG